MTAGASEQRVNKRRGFGAAKNDQRANKQEHDNDRRNEVSLVRHDEVEQLGDEATAAHGDGRLRAKGLEENAEATGSNAATRRNVCLQSRSKLRVRMRRQR